MSDLRTGMFFGGLVRLHIPYYATRGAVDMMEELRRHGDEVGPGTSHPMLHQREEVGGLTSHTEIVGGKSREYDRATAAGAEALEATRTRLRGLVKEILDDKPPTPAIRPPGVMTRREGAGRLAASPGGCRP